MAPDYKRQHRTGLHVGKSIPACTLCTQERDAAGMTEAHTNGQHEKLPRQKCPLCKAARMAQVARC